MSVLFTWFGHSAFLVEMDSLSILIDPFLSSNPLADVEPKSFSPDLIVLSNAAGHATPDAVDIAKRTKAPIIASFDESWNAINEIPNLIQIAPDQVYNTGNLEVLCVPANHPDGAHPNGPKGFIIASASAKIYYAGETGPFDAMQDIGEIGIQVALLPVGGQNVMTPAESLQALAVLQPDVVIPTHHNTLPGTMQDIGDWANQVNNQTASKPVVLDPGGTYTFA